MLHVTRLIYTKLDFLFTFSRKLAKFHQFPTIRFACKTRKSSHEKKLMKVFPLPSRALKEM